MKTVGIIAEYNPFHNGHAYHLKKAKEITGADYCIVVMSGDFVQRGAPALMDKYLRAKIALASGADLVLELPAYYALGSAEYFAGGAVTLLDKLGVVDNLCFGSECGDVALLGAFAELLLHENKVFKQTLDHKLRMGHSYPQARNAAIEASAPHLTAHIDILTTPNNILGIEYCKAILKRKSNIAPCSIRRAGSSYHDNSLQTDFCSARALREALQSSDRPDVILNQVPANARTLMEEQYARTYPIFADDLSLLMHYRLLSEPSGEFTAHSDIDKELSDRIVKYLPQYQDFSSFCDLLKSKNRTYTRIARSLVHILLQIRQEDLSLFLSEDQIFYARMLGFRESAGPLLSAIKQKASVPLLSKLADAENLLSSTGMLMLEKDIYASHVYQSIVRSKFPAQADTSEISEYKMPIVKL